MTRASQESIFFKAFAEHALGPIQDPGKPMISGNWS